MLSMHAIYLFTFLCVFPASSVYAQTPDFAALAAQAEKINPNKNPSAVIAILEPHINHPENKNVDYICNLALAYKKVGRLNESIQLGKRALGIAPDAFALHYNIAVAYFNAGRFIESCEHFRKSKELNPKHSGVNDWMKYMEKYHKCK